MCSVFSLNYLDTLSISELVVIFPPLLYSILQVSLAIFARLISEIVALKQDAPSAYVGAPASSYDHAMCEALKPF